MAVGAGRINCHQRDVPVVGAAGGGEKTKTGGCLKVRTFTENLRFDDIIAAFPDEIQSLARRLRRLIEEIHPEAVEVLWPNQKIAGFGIGPKKMSEHYGYIAPQTKHVNLGFMHGASLSDPEGLLQGTGKELRHVKVRSMAEAGRPGLRHLLQAAVAERFAANEPKK